MPRPRKQITDDQEQAIKDRLSDDVKAYLKSGGKITFVKRGVSGWKQKSFKQISSDWHEAQK